MNDTDRQILELASKWWRHEGSLDEAVREIGLTPTRYYQRLHTLIAMPEIEAEYPTVVHRLQRKATRRRTRSTHRLSFD